MATHGKCGKSWTGMNRSHCGACHETFNSEYLFNKHRSGPYDPPGLRKCASHEEMLDKQWRLKDNGIWFGPPSEFDFESLRKEEP